MTTCIQRPPVFKDHLVVSQLWLYNAFLPLLRDHLYSKTTFFWPKRGRLIQVSLYYQSSTNTERELYFDLYHILGQYFIQEWKWWCNNAWYHRVLWNHAGAYLASKFQWSGPGIRYI